MATAAQRLLIFYGGSSMSRSILTLAPLSGAVLAALSLSTSPPTLAQDEQDEVRVGLEEIIVTARFREENLQRTPVAITAVLGEELTAMGFTNMSEMRRGGGAIERLGPRKEAFGGLVVAGEYYKIGFALALLTTLEYAAPPLISTGMLVGSTQLLGIEFDRNYELLAIFAALLSYTVVRPESKLRGMFTSGWTVRRASASRGFQSSACCSSSATPPKSPRSILGERSFYGSLRHRPS